MIFFHHLPLTIYHKIQNMKNLALLIFAPLFFSCQSKEEITQQQYSVEGMALYQTHCENCHQADGSGLRNLYPSIKNVNLSPETLACLIKNGKKGNGYMPANAKLQPLDIAEIVTYMRDKWGGKKQIFPVDSVRLALQKCP
jgi:mono/diheme cytochrome c family protein